MWIREEQLSQRSLTLITAAYIQKNRSIDANVHEIKWIYLIILIKF